MAPSTQPAKAAVAPPTGVPAVEAGDIAQLEEDLDGSLTRLRFGAIREQLDGLLDEAPRWQLNLREALAWLCAAEVASKEQRHLSMAMTIAHFPFVRTLEGFEFEVQPSIDPAKIRDLATCSWVANGDNVVLLSPPAVGKYTWRWPWSGRPSPAVTACISPLRQSCSLPLSKANSGALWRCGSRSTAG
jgi:hypothetical protein